MFWHVLFWIRVQHSAARTAFGKYDKGPSIPLDGVSFATDSRGWGSSSLMGGGGLKNGAPVTEGIS